MPSEWNMFVKKIYEEGKAKDPNYKFKQALVDASKRKSEMGHSKSSNKQSVKQSMHKKSRKASAAASISGGRRRKSRKTRRH